MFPAAHSLVLASWILADCCFAAMVDLLGRDLQPGWGKSRPSLACCRGNVERVARVPGWLAMEESISGSHFGGGGGIVGSLQATGDLHFLIFARTESPCMHSHCG